VIGLCQQLGARGFQQLKIALARDLVQPVQFIHEDVNRDDETATIIEKIFRSDMQALQDTLKVIDQAAMSRAVTAILGA
uniref:MurR/RpiR family transcriptional regulator n=1 Tax=Stenotrophomonas sp. GbtcB23 TaxID=2824768 RepID=UPI001C30DB9D